MADSQDAIELRRRARRRLVGAIALVVFMVIVLPIVLDREPKPVSQELTIQIPSQDAGRFASRVPPPEPPPAAPAADAAPAAPVTVTPLAAPSEATQARSDKAEPAATKPKPEAVPAPVARAEKPAAVPSPAPKDAKSEAAKADAVKAEPMKTEATKMQAARTEATRSEASKAEPAKAEAAKADVAKTDITKADVAKADVAKADITKSDATKSDAGYVVPLGLFSKPDNIKQVRGKASAAGIKTYTEAMAGSDRVRVRAGPFPTRDAAEKAREKLKAAGLDVGAVAAR